METSENLQSMDQAVNMETSENQENPQCMTPAIIKKKYREMKTAGFIAPCPENIRTMKQTESMLKDLHRLAASHLPANEALPKAVPVSNPEPLNLNRRVVFREAGSIPMGSIAAMHHLIQSVANEATNTLSYFELEKLGDHPEGSLYSGMRNLLDE